MQLQSEVIPLNEQVTIPGIITHIALTGDDDARVWYVFTDMDTEYSLFSHSVDIPEPWIYCMRSISDATGESAWHLCQIPNM